MKAPTVVLVAGGTGGHVFPAEALSRTLPTQGVLITDTRGARFAKTDAFSAVEILPSAPLKGTLGKIFFLGIAFIHALRLLYRLKPRVVWGFGGMMTVPILWAAWVLRIPTGIHQADRVLGKANQILSYTAKVLATTFPNPEGGRQPAKGIQQVVTGLPIRPEIEAARGTPYPLRSEKDPLHLLILGGSQGATFWGDILPKAVAQLSPQNQRLLHLTHQGPKGDLEVLQQAYGATQAHVTLTPFIADMATALTQSHVVCARSGASTLAELCAAGRPVLLVPYPFAADDHQRENAAHVVDQGAGWMIPQDELTVENLTTFLTQCLEDPSQLAQAAGNIAQLFPPKGAEQLKHQVLGLI